MEKQRTVFPHALAKRCCVSHSSHRLDGGQATNNKTGHFTCYKNRTFLFATDSAFRMNLRFRQWGREDFGDGGAGPDFF
jgi:hypothetical protein